MNLFHFRLPALFLLLFLTLSCKKQANEQVAANIDEEKELLARYFDAATSGVISASEPFHYILKSPLPADVDENALQDFIRLDPSVNGNVTISNRSVITFTPEKPLAGNTVYRVSLNMPLLDTTNFTDQLTYSVQTIEQQVRLEKRGFILQDNGKTDVIVSVRTADILDLKSLESCFTTKKAAVSCRQSGDLLYEVTFSYDNLPAANKPIEFDGNQIQAKHTETIQPFSINAAIFEVVHSDHDKESNELNLYFSKILDNRQDLTGLLTLNGKMPNYSIDQNVVKIFLDQDKSSNTAEVNLSSALQATDGSRLKQDYTYSIENKTDTPMAEFVSAGNYFPSEGDFKIPVKTRGLDKIKVVVIEIKQENVMHFLAWHSLQYSDYYSLRMYGKPIYEEVIPLNKGLKDEDGFTIHGIDLTKQVKKNPGSIYHVSLDFLPEHTNLSCKSNLKKYKVQYGTPSNQYFYSKNADFREEYIYYPDYSWDKNTDPCDISYYAYKQPAQKLLICSDFSVIAKKAGGSYHVAVNKLLDLSAVSGADITLYDLQAEKIGQGVTGADGLVRVECPKHEGSVMKITKDNQTTYLSLDEADSNPLTEFDISGELSETGTEVFVYTDRDVWRPGDSIFLNVMFHAKNAEVADGLPLVCSFYNPENVQIVEKVLPLYLGKKQIYTFGLNTSPGAKTGRYRCVLRWGTRTHREIIQVETIKPNTTETVLETDNTENKVVYASTLSGKMYTRYLTGFAAPNTEVKAVGKFVPMDNPFPDYGQYVFQLPAKPAENNIELFQTRTNEAGQADFETGYDFTAANAPGYLRVEIESTLEGGGINKEGKSIKISPFTSYLGAERKPGKGWAGNYTFDENINVNLIRLDKKGKLLSSAMPVTYTVYKHAEHWWIDKYRLQHWGNFQQDGFWTFVNTNNMNVSGKGLLSLPKNSLGKGAYKVVFTDKNSGHQTAVFFTVYNGEESIPGKEAHLLELMTEKDDYMAGEKIALRLPDIKGAKALVSVERGKEIIQQTWHELKAGGNIISLSSDESWASNIYLHLTIIQPYKKSGNDLPLRMYGVKSVRLTGKNKPLQPVTDIPITMESDKKYTFTISEQNGRPMEYTYALVDEGLLSLKGFNTPDPVTHFFGKYPLLVKTWDIYKYLMSYFSGQFAGIISIGGDDAYKADALQEINRFKPVVIHRGSFILGPKAKNKHEVTIPKYIGKLRLMVVACHKENFGHLEKMVTVKNPIMVQTQFPRNLQVTDKVRLPITLFRDDATIRTATLTATTSNPLIKGLPSNKNITFGNENMVRHFSALEVLNKPGVTKVDMTVKSNQKSMSEKTELVVQYPNAYSSIVERVRVQPGKSAFFEVSPKGYPEVFSGRLIVSGVRAPDFMTFAEKLIEYPYGCLEQVTSAGFGQLYLDKLLDLDPAANKKRLDHLKVVTQKISGYQRGGGSFYYWDNDYYHGWSDMYAGHFLLEMKNSGNLPPDNRMFQDWLSNAYQKANQWSVAGVNDKYFYESEALMHAYRLYILAKANKPAKSAMNRFMTTCTARNPLVWWLLAGSFQHSGFDSKALEMITKAETLTKDKRQDWYSYSFGSQARDLAVIVNILSGIKGQKAKAEKYFNAMVDAYNASNWNSTQDMGYACLATFSFYGENLSLNKDVQYAVTGLKAIQNYKHKASAGRDIRVDKAYWNKKLEVKNTGTADIYVTRYARYIDDKINLPAEQKEIGLTIRYYNLTRKTSGLDDITLGDDIQIVVTVQNDNATALRDMALNLTMPSGFELINPRLYQTEVVKTQAAYTYQDFRDDRVYTFFSLDPGAKKYFEFKAKASFAGDFYLPRAVCENMYKGNIYAKTAAGRVTIRE